MQADRNKNTQRERLLAAIVAVISERGYEHATIARVVSHAGVSRPTFYEYFASREACFFTALTDTEDLLIATIACAVAAQPPERAAPAAVVALVTFAQEHPAEARLLMHETMAAGRMALDARDRGVDQIARLIEDAQRSAAVDVEIPALPGAIIAGTTYRLLAARLRRGERALTSLQDDLLDWLSRYACPAAQQPWQALRPAPTSAGSPLIGPAPLRAPPARSPGRPRRSAPSVTENHRLRIIFATIDVIREGGYSALTVAGVAQAAGVERRAFYRLFADKQDALTAVHEFIFQNVMAVTAGAFFAAEEWPQRIWQAARAFTLYLDQNPGFTRMAVIESHVGRPDTVQRHEDLLVGFTIFLQEGYQFQPRRQQSPPSRVELEAVAHANFELLFRQARSANPNVAGLATRLTYISLAPFLGTGRTRELIEEMLSS